MPAQFDIDLDAIEVPTEPSVTFRLEGRVWACKATDAIPATIIDAVATGSIQIGPFFASVLVPEDVDDFAELLHRPDTPLTIGRLEALIEPLVERLMDRPTERPKLSQRGPRTTGGTSTGALSSQGTPRRRSAS